MKSTGGGKPRKAKALKALDDIRSSGHLGRVTNYNQRYAFVTAQALDARRGGTRARDLMALLDALSRRGKQIGLVAPSAAPPLGLAGRWWFNRHLPRTLGALVADAAIGIDGDGYRFARASRTLRFVAFLLGNRADERAATASPGHRPRAIEVAWESHAARAADLVVTPSRYLADRAAARYGVPGDRVAVVPFGVDSARWPYVPPSTTSPPRVLFIRGADEGGPDADLLRLWKRIHSTYPDAQCTVAHYAGPEGRRVPQDGTGPRVISVSRADGIDGLREDIRTASVVCVSEQAERQGLGPLAVMATGRAIVAPHAGSMPEIIGDAGALVPPGDCEALVSTCLHLLGATQERDQLGLHARERAVMRSWSAAAQCFGSALATL